MKNILKEKTITPNNMKTAITDYFQNVIGKKYSIYFEQQDIDCLLDIIQQPSPTVTDEEIERMAEHSSEVQEATYTPQHKVTYKHGYYDGFKSAQSRLSQPVRECKYVWFVENENNEWLVNKKTFTNNPLEAAQFSSEEEAVEYIIHSELHDCKPTQHEFVSQPVKAYCTCDFTMINRDQETQIPFCFECKKEINESQPVTGYSEEDLREVMRMAREGTIEYNHITQEDQVIYDHKPDEIIQSLKSKPNNGSNGE